MLSRFKLMFLILVLITLTFAQDKTLPVLEINDEVVTLGEFEKEYLKNAGNKEQKKDNFEDYKNFLNLYSGFKLKLIEAKKFGYDKDPELLKEFQLYKENVSQTYYITKYIKDAGLKKLYQKSLKEYRASHLLLQADSTRDLNASRELAMKLIDSLQNGAEWKTIVEKYSDDKTTIKTGGDIYYFAGTQVPSDLQEALFNTKVNDVYSKPIRSRFGWHVVRVTEIIDRVPAVKARHILVMHKDSEGNYDEEKAKKKCEDLYQRVKNGEDFAELAKKYSDDKGSAVKGGELGFIPRRQTVREFDELLFKTGVGEISKVFRTQFGYHFLQVLDKKPQETYSEFLNTGTALYDKRYYNKDFRMHMDMLIDKYQYVIDEESLGKIDSSYFKMTVSQIAGDSVVLNKINEVNFLKKGEESFELKDLILEFAQTKYNVNKLSVKLLSHLIRARLDKILLSKEVEKLSSTDQDFQSLMTEYKNGLLIFKLQQNDIWKNINVTLQDRRDYYLTNKSDFIWPERLAITKYSNKDPKAMNEVEKMLKGNASESELKSISNLKIEQDTIFAKSNNDISKMVYNLEENQTSRLFRLKSGGFCVVKLNKKLQETPKTFNECKAEIAGKIVEKKNQIAEEKYIEKLKEKYKPEYFYDNLKKAFK